MNFKNTIIVGNTGIEKGGGIFNNNSRINIVNSIFWNNESENGINDIYLRLSVSSDTVYLNMAYSSFSSTDSLSIKTHQVDFVKEEDGGDSNLYGDPLFADPDNGDFHLEISSECIDQGTAHFELDTFDPNDGDKKEIVLDLEKTDYSGFYPDIGVFESAPADDFLPYDIDGNGRLETNKDSILIARYLMKIRGGQALIGPYEEEPVIGENATRITSEEIATYLEKLKSLNFFDLDGNGKSDALTDGVLLTRYMEGTRGEDLIWESADLVNGIRKTAEEIVEFIEGK